MKKAFKRSLSILLIFLLTIVVFPSVTFGAQNTESSDGNWKILADYNTNTCTITGYNGSSATLNFPSSIDGLKVTSLACEKRINNSKNITAISIPSTVKTLSYGCFSYLPELTSVTIPASVKTIDGAVFSHCTSLKEFTMPSQIKQVPEGMFAGCESLEKVTLHSKVTSIGGSAFFGCDSLTTIKLPSSLKTIGDCAFTESGLTSISIPNSVTDTGSDVFRDCASLAKVKLSTNMKALKLSTFSGCASLKSITIPSGCKDIGYKTFIRCPNLTTVVLRGNPAIPTYSGPFETTAALTIYAPSSASNAKAYCSEYGIRFRSLDSPTLTSKKRTATTATLKWKAVSGATGYKVYKKTGTGSYKLVKTTTGTSFKSTGLKKGTTYRFYVTTLKKDALGQTIESKSSTVYKTYLKK